MSRNWYVLAENYGIKLFLRVKLVTSGIVNEICIETVGNLLLFGLTVRNYGFVTENYTAMTINPLLLCTAALCSGANTENDTETEPNQPLFGLMVKGKCTNTVLFNADSSLS